MDRDRAGSREDSSAAVPAAKSAPNVATNSNSNNNSRKRPLDHVTASAEDAMVSMTGGHSSTNVTSSRAPVAKMESFTELLLHASKSTVLNWWDPEAIECTMACGEEEEKAHANDVHSNYPVTKFTDSASSLVDNSIIQKSQSSYMTARSSRSSLFPEEDLESKRAELRATLQSVLTEKTRPTISKKHVSHAQEPDREQDSTEQEQPQEADTVMNGYLLENELQKLKEDKGKSSNAARSIATTANNSSSSSLTSDEDDENIKAARDKSWKGKWEHFVKRIGDYIARILTVVALVAARNPYWCIILTVLVSIATVATGMFTNFSVVVENYELWPPHNSFSVQHTNWLYEISGFHYEYRYIKMIVHADGDNVLSVDGLSHAFEAMNVVQNMSDYQQGCRWAKLVGDAYQVGECHIHSVTDFWNHSMSAFHQQSPSDDDVLLTMSGDRYPDGEPVDLTKVLGNIQWGQNQNGNASTLVSAQSFLIDFFLPWSYETHDFEWVALMALFDLQEQWKSEPSNPFRLEVNAYRSYEDEFLRAILADLPLLPAVFVITSLFTCLVFWRYDRVQSRALLGFGAVVTILLSIVTSHGLMFILGVPFTTSTMMLPFLMFGIGLDDAFIIIGSYIRIQETDTLKRIEMTMKDIGLSICITTLTSAVAFALGCFSSIPSVRWLCFYACPSVIIDFIYQITFFVALLVLDERRVQSRRMDCCVCVQVGEKDEEDGLEDGQEAEDTKDTPPLVTVEDHWTDRFMGWYADKLLEPKAQTIVLLAFFALLATSTYYTTQLTQYFDLNDMVPHDSYLRGYHNTLSRYAQARTGLASYAFFRGLNHSDPGVQHQMFEFVDELAVSGSIESSPVNFWLRDFLEFTNGTESNTAISNLTFNEKVDAFLKVPLYNKLYDDHIVLDSKTGDIIDSRCEIYIVADLGDAKAGVEALDNLRQVSSSQPINEGLSGSEWKMFTYQDMYNLWEFYSRVISELSLTTILGVVAVCVVGLLLIPHWTAVLFVTPLIICLYVDMLGYISYSNVNVNAISYVQLVMSIGLMVDFIMHILMRYYECKGTRRERVKTTLQTMGASIFVGGFSSLLGVVLLAFSSSQILRLVFVAVLGLVALGIVHGLVFLPVILSLIGPQ